MMWQCPLCNGFMQEPLTCSQCSSKMEDAGKLSDYYAPYSPYWEIDDLKMTNGFVDLQSQQCIHLFYCPACEQEQIGAIAEKAMGTVPEQTQINLE